MGVGVGTAVSAGVPPEPSPPPELPVQPISANARRATTTGIIMENLDMFTVP